MDPEHSNFLCFLWNGSLYRFLTLCFGIKNAPFIFHRVGRAIILHFNSLGIRLIIYLDDILVLGRTPGQCVRDAQIFVDTLVKLGFHFKIGKCVLKPSQEFFFLGFIWNTVTMQVHLPEEKLLTIHMLSLEILSKKKVQVLALQRIMGLISSTRPAVPLAKCRSRGIQRMILDLYNGTEKSAKKYVTPSKWAIEDLTWWSVLQSTGCSQTFRTVPVWKSIRLATDAMDYAVGSVLQGEIFYMELSEEDIQRNIAHKEWLAFEMTILRKLDMLRNQVVTWHVDNQVVRAVWLKEGSTRDLWLCKRVIKLRLLLQEQNTVVVPVYIKSAQHIHADYVSRNKRLPDWHLSHEIAMKIFQLWGWPEIDLMATQESTQVQRYFSALEDSKATGIDALVKDWNQFSLAYVFPPPVMMELILNRIFQCSPETDFIVISPWKPKAQWFSKMLHLTNIPPVRLPVSTETVVDLAGSTCVPRTPSGGKIKFVAWKLSGGGGLSLDNCPLGLAAWYSRAGREQLRKITDWASDIIPTFAKGMNWTSLHRIQLH